MNHQRRVASVTSHEDWAAIIQRHYSPRGVALAPLGWKDAVRAMHDMRREIAERSSVIADEELAVLIAVRTGQGTCAARWILQSLKHEERRAFAQALRPLRTSFDANGRSRVPLRIAEAAAAAGIIRYYASMNDLQPAQAVQRLFSQPNENEWDAAASQAAFVAIVQSASSSAERDPAGTFARSRKSDWAAAVEDAFDCRGRRRKRLNRRAAMEMLARIAGEANCGTSRLTLHKDSCTVDPEFSGLRRACELLYARTYLVSPVHALMVITALKSISKSKLLFPSLIPTA